MFNIFRFPLMYTNFNDIFRDKRGFLVNKLKLPLRKFYGCHHDLVDRYRIRYTYDHRYVLLVVITIRSFPYSWLIYHRVRSKSNTTCVICGAGTAYPSGTHEYAPGFQWGSCSSIFSQLWFVDYCWSFFSWPLHCLAFFVWRLLVSSDHS